MTGDSVGSDRSRSPRRLELGSPVHGADGSFGELADIVIDPSTRRVTHLVVQPHDRHDLARLVPVARAHTEATSDATISLDCTVAEINALEPIQKSAYLRLGEFSVEDPDWDVGIEEMFALPYYQSVDGMGVGMQAIDPDPHVAISYDRVPKGEVEIRRASDVTSSNGEHLGHVDGFVVDGEGHIAHLVLEHGHLWGKREIAIPIGAVARTQSDEVVLSWSTDEVGALKPLPVHRWQS
jgi:sporulation protein YlmC with PRC-barrel domain